MKLDDSRQKLDGEPVRLPRRKLPALLDVALPAVAVGSGAMLFLALPNIIDGGDLWSHAKASTLALSATVVSFGINKLAIERGAPLATTGYLGAALVSVGSMLAVGGGLFAATYSGLVFKDVAGLQLQEHGTALAAFVGSRSAAAAEAGRVDPAMRAIVDDLTGKAECEVSESCISGNGTGGRGPVARMTAEHAGRAVSVAQQVASAEIARGKLVAKLNDHIAEYQAILGGDDNDVWQRRVALQKVDALIVEATGELDEAVPLALLTAYAGELQAGAGIADGIVTGNRASEAQEATTRLGGILSRHGQSLAAVIAGIGKDRVAPPPFPARTGVSDTFGYFAHFLPVAAIAAVVELVFPMVLWAYTFWTLSWEAYKRQPLHMQRGDHGAGFDHPSRRHQDSRSSTDNRRGRFHGNGDARRD